MGFGPIMSLTVGELDIKLRPIARDDMQLFVDDGGLQTHTVARYLGRRPYPVLEDEFEWFDAVRKQKDSRIWGIYVVDGSSLRLIGSSGLHGIGKTDFGDAFRIANSGSLIFRREYWGRGIAKHIHMARTWYGFTQLGLARIVSAVFMDNLGSMRALQNSGYYRLCVDRNTHFCDGQLRHTMNMNVINPDPMIWRSWWHEDRPPKIAREARVRTINALHWAQQHVTLD